MEGGNAADHESQHPDGERHSGNKAGDVANDLKRSASIAEHGSR
jgi:hypothetical protein